MSQEKNTAERSPKGYPNRGVCVRIEGVKNNPKTRNQCTVYERNGQLVFALNSEIMLPENAPVRLTSAQLEELDYRKLYRAYLPKGRKSKVDPRVMFKVMVYGYQCGIYSSRKLEGACRYRIDFMWLLEDKPAPDHATVASPWFPAHRPAQFGSVVTGINDGILDGTEVIQPAAVCCEILTGTYDLCLAACIVSPQKGLLRGDAEHVKDTAGNVFADAAVGIGVKIAEGGGDRRHGDPRLYRIGRHLPLRVDKPLDGAAEVVVQQQVFQSGVFLKGLFFLAEKNASSDAAAAPHQGTAAVIQTPSIGSGNWAHQQVALCIGDDLDGIQRLADTLNKLRPVPYKFRYDPAIEPACRHPLFLQGGQAAGKYGLADKRQRNALIQSGNTCPLSGALLTRGVQNIVQGAVHIQEGGMYFI